MSASERNPVTNEARAAAFAAGPPKLSSKVIIIGLAVLVGLAIAGTLLERLFSSVGLNAAADTGAKSEPALGVVTMHLSATSAPGGKALADFLDTQALAHNPAPVIDLVDQRGAAFSLASLRGKVVVLSFFDARCDDICPVVASEIGDAERDLGPKASGVAFVTVNSDPNAVRYSANPPALSASGLGGLANVYFLTGPLGALDNIWRVYGISIEAASSGTIAHNELMYFITPSGRLSYRVSPYGDESRSGAYDLSATLERRFGEGIATYAGALLEHSPRSSPPRSDSPAH